MLVNLLVNAAQSFGANDPTTNRVSIGATSTEGYVSISVADNGDGIAPDVLPRIF